VLYGDDAPRNLPEDYQSGGADRLELWLDAPFTIDGEFFTPARDRPVVITADETIRFVRL
jgi:diacylglycerol kinase (ATP)